MPHRHFDSLEGGVTFHCEDAVVHAWHTNAICSNRIYSHFTQFMVNPMRLTDQGAAIAVASSFFFVVMHVHV